jgi:mutator protein MutT
VLDHPCLEWPGRIAGVRVVVGGAVVRDGRVLGTRRTRPPETAGRWELPGGKVDAAESPEEALVRELREELGCTVRPTGRLEGEQPVGTDHVLRVLVAELVDGEPVPGEHDMVRWLAPEELDDLDWLEPDRPFLVELRDLLLDGLTLEGGNVGGAVRIGRTVRRPAGPWTPAVHALLDHVRAKGLTAVPRVHGTDARGREVLSFLPGRIVDVDDELLTDGQLRAAAGWLRDLHDATSDADVAGPWRWFEVPSPTVLGHNDVAPYNLCFEGDTLVGVFDWDLAGPTTPVLDLAQLAWTGVPLYRERDAAEAARRLTVMTDAYGGPAPREVLHAVVDLKRIGCAGIRRWIADGDPAGAAQAAVGEPERTEAAVAELAARIPAIEQHLR